MRTITLAALLTCTTLLSSAALALDGSESFSLQSEDSGNLSGITLDAPALDDSKPAEAVPSLTTTVETAKSTLEEAPAKAVALPDDKGLIKETIQSTTTVETTTKTTVKEETGNITKATTATAGKTIVADYPAPVKIYPGAYTGQPDEYSQEAVLWLISEARYHMLTGNKEKAAKSLENASTAMFELNRRNELSGTHNAVRALYISYAIADKSIGIVVPLFGNSNQASVGSWDSAETNPELTDLQATLVNLRFNNMMASDIKDAQAKVNAGALMEANDILSKSQERDLRYFYFSSVGYDKGKLALETAETLAKADAFTESKRLLKQVKETLDKANKSSADRELDASFKSFGEKLDAALASDSPSPSSIAELREQWNKWSSEKGRFGDK
ncbi:hypothetical protein GC177_03355 [bacterium]|nr:hypothetical protein [bacterium]